MFFVLINEIIKMWQHRTWRRHINPVRFISRLIRDQRVGVQFLVIDLRGKKKCGFKKGEKIKFLLCQELLE
jgi:hypothetical protein